MLTVRGCAKVNLTLEVLGRRPDGYHQIVSLVQLVGLYDTLTIEPAEGLELSCNEAQLAGPDNLVLKAAALLRKVTGCRRGAKISLHKGIPAGSGLGGGSSDAAAALKALNELWGLGLDGGELVKLGAEVGSDVPLFFGGPTVLVEGRGEVVTPVSPLPARWLLLLVPPLSLPHKTASMYARLEAADFSDGSLTRRAIEAVGRGTAPEPLLCYNAFQRASSLAFPELEDHRRRLLAAGAGHVFLAGSGPALFSLMDGEAHGREVRSGLQGEAYLVRTISA